MSPLIAGVLIVAAVGGLAAFLILCVRHAWSGEFMHPDAETSPLRPIDPSPLDRRRLRRDR